MGRAIAIGASVVAVLVLFGVLTTPGFLTSSGVTGVAAAAAILLAYGLAGRFGVPAARRRQPIVVEVAARCALAAGAVYSLEIGLEYVVLPKDNTTWGLVEFGLVFIIIALAGAAVGRRTGQLRPAALAGVWTAMGASLIWYAVILAVFYAFRGTVRQEAVLSAEGDFEDFRRSGLADLRVFLMGDMLGAGFFHLLLSPLVGLVLGTLGGAGALLARRLGRVGTGEPV